METPLVAGKIIWDFIYQYFVEQSLFSTVGWSLCQEMMREARITTYSLSPIMELPERQFDRFPWKAYCQLGALCNKYWPRKISFATGVNAFHTTRQLAAELWLTLRKSKWTCFQKPSAGMECQDSKTPIRRTLIKECGSKGSKTYLVFSQLFVAELLETDSRSWPRDKEKFEELGGEHWDLSSSLNSSDLGWNVLKDDCGSRNNPVVLVIIPVLSIEHN